MNSNFSSLSSHDILRSILELLPPVDRDVFACKIASVHTNWKSLCFGQLQFNSLASAQKALDLSGRGLLSFQRASLSVSESSVDIVPQGGAGGGWRLDDVAVRFGNLAGERELEVIGEWKGARVEVVDGRGGKTLLICVEDGWETYKLEVLFADVVNNFECLFSDAEESNAVLLQMEIQDASLSERGILEIDVGDQIPGLPEQIMVIDLPSTSNGRSSPWKNRMGFMSGTGRNFIVLTFRRWGHGSGGGSSEIFFTNKHNLLCSYV